MPLFTRKRLLLAKAEVTYGVDSVPVGAQGVLVRNLNLTPMQANLANRELVRSFLGNSEQYVDAPYVQVEFEVEMAGSGTAGTAPAYDAILKACGMATTIVAATSVTYAPISASFPSVTIYCNVDGVLHRITGARGNVSLVLEAGQIPYFRFTFLGLFNAPTDTAFVAPAYNAYRAPLVVNTDNTPTFTLDGYAGAMQSLNIDMGNDLSFRRLVGATDIQLSGRSVSGSILIEAPTIAQKNYWSVALGTVNATLNVVHGKTAGNIVQVQATNSVSLGNPAYQDQDGIQMLNIPFNMVPVSGNDEISIIVR